MADETEETKAEETEAEATAEAPDAATEAPEAAEEPAAEAVAESGEGAVSEPATEAATESGEETGSEPAEGTEGEADPWAEAMAEQEASEVETPLLGGEPAAVAVVQQPAATFAELKAEAAGKGISNLELILDIPVTISVELGRTKLYIKDLLSLGQGAVMELDKLAGDPMEIFVNGHLIAKGETVVVNDKFGIKLTDIVSPSERITNLA